MATYNLTAFRTAPLCRFVFQKYFDTMFLYKFEVVYHAHMVFGTVTFIESLQAAASEIRAFVTEANEPVTQSGTLLLHQGTVLAPWQASGAVFLPEPLLFQVIFHRQVAYAYAAIHPTRGD